MNKQHKDVKHSQVLVMEDILGQQHKIKSIDCHFGGFMARLAGEEWKCIASVAGMVSMATRAGHACLDFRNNPEELDLICNDADLAEYLPEEWPPELEGCPVIGDGKGTSPLVLDDGRLYLRRYWEYENDIAGYLRLKVKGADCEVDLVKLEKGLDRLFPGCHSDIDWQKLAVCAAMLRPFVVITGGPGTGKTTTLVRFIALLLEQHAGKENFRIALAAPTGKGVARLQDVISDIGRNLDCSEDVRSKIPAGAMTLHRLLGPIKGSPFFKFNEDNRLPFDLVVVDEASMVDLPLMAKLTRALSTDARLILLGDHNQLASVEPGSVLGDLCDQVMVDAFTGKFRRKVSKILGSDKYSLQGEPEGRRADSLVELKDSYRFDEKSGIGRLSKALKEGDSVAALDILTSGRYSDTGWREAGSVSDLRSLLEKRWGNELPKWLIHKDPLKVLNQMSRRQILCAVRRGPYGVEVVNGYVRSLLETFSGITSGDHVNYHGQPIMVVKNDHEHKLYNGDTGVIMADPEKGGRLFAFFNEPGKGLRRIPLAILAASETVYAMTVHKSQGSEFDEVVIILPEDMSPVLTRELIYTAVTRARNKVEVWGTDEIFRRTVELTINRQSGLKGKLAKV